MTTQSNTPAGWYPDPHGASQTLRYWDGTQWTDQTNQQGAVPGQAPDADPKVQRQVQQQAGVAGGGAGGGTLFTEPVLVVNQKAKLIELTNEYKVMDQHGRELGSVVEVGQSALKKVLRFVSSLDQFMTHRLEIRDAHGQPQLVLTGRPSS